MSIDAPLEKKVCLDTLAVAVSSYAGVIPADSLSSPKAFGEHAHKLASKLRDTRIAALQHDSNNLENRISKAQERIAILQKNLAAMREKSSAPNSNGVSPALTPATASIPASPVASNTTTLKQSQSLKRPRDPSKAD